MYNGVGLTTPRGSGTSGYVQQNLAYISRPRTRVDFKKEFDQIKANPPKPPKKPNAEIMEHEQKRQIEIELLKFRDKLEAQKEAVEEVERKVKTAREYLYEKLKGAPLLKTDTSHDKVAKKEKEMERLKSAFGIMDNYVPGAAFDFEAIAEREEKEKEDREIKRALEAREKELPQVPIVPALSKPEPRPNPHSKPEKKPMRRTENRRSHSHHRSRRRSPKSESRSRSPRRRGKESSSSSSSSDSSSSSRSSSSSSQPRRRERSPPRRRRRRS